MKMNRIFALGLSAALACSCLPAAFAEDMQDGNPAGYDPAPVVDTQEEIAETDPIVTRLSARATVKEILEQKAILVETEDGQELQLNLSETTLFADASTGLPTGLVDVKAGDTVYAYYSPAMTRSLPPQSTCELLLTGVTEGKTVASLHTVGQIDRAEDGTISVLNAAGDMVIRMNDETAFSPFKTRNIVTSDDLRVGTRFLAWYDIVLMSYPGQAYTDRVVLLDPVTNQSIGARGEASADSPLAIVAGGKKLDVSGVLQDGLTAVVPVRAAAEALGCKVSYVQEGGKEYVTIESDTRTMTLTIGEDLYVSATTIEDAVGMTAPIQLGVAPYITEGTTWAPADLFEVLVGFDVSVADGVVTIAPQA
ncbi:hypothetical protein JQM60_01340 [Butyricicoccus pullicaecorum]|nr:hypothetical protein [Butyricicoccus pullicaecorum]